jgi:uncharacterized protein involved in tellurium resistance
MLKKRILMIMMFLSLLVFSFIFTGCNNEGKTGGTLTVKNTTTQTYEVNIIDGSGVRVTGGNIAANASRNFSFTKDDAFTIRYRIFWTSDTWNEKYASISNGNAVTVNIP